MGEATYYAKLRFKTKSQAQDNVNDVRHFCSEMGEAEDWWQSHRGDMSNFWVEFEIKFPQAYEFLKYSHKVNGGWNNELAGILSIGQIADINTQVFVKDSMVCFSFYTWHLASWNELGAYLVYKSKADSFNWTSDEHADLFDCI